MDNIRISRIDNIQWREPKKDNRIGTLHITTSHVLFIDTNRQEEWILHSHIASLERVQFSKNAVNHHVHNNVTSPTRYSNSPNFSSNSILKIKLKLFKSINILLNNDIFGDLLMTLKVLSRPNQITELYAFSYNLPGDRGSHPTDSLSPVEPFFSFQAEFARQGAFSSGKFHLSDINKNYSLCKTYPNELCFPYNATSTTITGSARFRSRQRLPALTYYHNSSTGSIHRCSQPLSGLQNNRSFDDEQLCQLICQSGKSNSYIIDTRPKLNAMANRAQGKGYEDDRFYKFCRCLFFPIENIHVVRNSLEKFTDSIEASQNFYDFQKSSLDSGWISHLHSIMNCSLQGAEWVSQGSSIILHCSDGWDRTSQVCALSQIFLDPFYRTVKGFCQLIEKDWCSFGHQFQHRLGQLNLIQYNPSHGSQNLEQEQSPVFLQWIECVRLILINFPEHFEFDSDFLIFLNYHSSSCQFGNFLTNNQKDRSCFINTGKTNCLWKFICSSENIGKFKARNINLAFDLLKPYKSFLKQRPWDGYKFWSEMYRQKLVDFDKIIEQKEIFPSSLKVDSLIPQKYSSARIYEQGWEKSQGGQVAHTDSLAQKPTKKSKDQNQLKCEKSPAPERSTSLPPVSLSNSSRDSNSQDRAKHISGASNSSNNSEKLASQLGYCKIDESSLQIVPELTLCVGKKKSNLLEEGGDPLGVL